MKTVLKKELHQLVDNCENEILLSEAKQLLAHHDGSADWWEKLTNEDKKEILQAEQEYEKGNFISNDEMMKKIAAWKKK